MFPSQKSHLSRIDSRLTDLTEEIATLRLDVTRLIKTVETEQAAHRERILSLESFRRWAVGVMTGVVLSGVTAFIGRIITN